MRLPWPRSPNCLKPMASSGTMLLRYASKMYLQKYHEHTTIGFMGEIHSWQCNSHMMTTKQVISSSTLFLSYEDALRWQRHKVSFLYKSMSDASLIKPFRLKQTLHRKVVDASTGQQ